MLNALHSLMFRALRNGKGTTAIEYGLIVAMIVIGAMTTLGTNFDTVFGRLEEKISITE